MKDKSKITKRALVLVLLECVLVAVGTACFPVMEMTTTDVTVALVLLGVYGLFMFIYIRIMDRRENNQWTNYNAYFDKTDGSEPFDMNIDYRSLPKNNKRHK